jgi:AcrR family transcriptional regulator
VSTSDGQVQLCWDGVVTLGGETSQTLDRGVKVLQHLASAGPTGMSVSQLAQALDVGRPVVYRLVATLAEHDLVRRFADGQIRLSVGLLTLATGAQSTVRQVAQPILRDLANAVGATAHLTLADGDEAFAVAVEEPSWTDFHVSYRVGSVHPVSLGAAGKAILAGRVGDRSIVESRGELQAGAHGYALPLIGIPGLEGSVGVVALSPLDAALVADKVDVAARQIVAALTAS